MASEIGSSGMKAFACDRRPLLILLLLGSLALSVYWPVGGYPFITLDDEEYVTMNPGVLQGVTAEKVRWAFGTFHAANWHPLTWLSHMVDVEFFGLDPGWHHRINLALHLANTALLFLVLRALTGAVWRAGFVAALFAVHPYHVESVAWVAERKDLLCALFWLLSVRAYGWYAARGGWHRYAAVTAFFLLGLMSKPMIVTLPFVFLLLDYWPLRRMTGGHAGGASPPPVRIALRRLLIEKIPWLFLSSAASLVTFVAQKEGGAMGSIAELPLAARMGNAAISYAMYLWKFAWPTSLAVFYPHTAVLSNGLSWWKIAASVSVLLAISTAAWWFRRSRPYFLVGWLFFLGTLVPVIGWVQVGMQAMADRYMYIPMVGLSVILSWGGHDLTRGVPRRAMLSGIGGGAVVFLLAFAASLQVSLWKDSVTLFRHASNVTPANWTAYFNLADALLTAGEVDEAIGFFVEGLRHRPDEVDARLNLGKALGERGRYPEAAEQFREILRRRPGDHLALVNLGVTLDRLGRSEEALAFLRTAVDRKPDFVDAYTNLGGVLLKMGRREEAVAVLRHALRLNPNDPVGRELLQSALMGGGR